MDLDAFSEYFVLFVGAYWFTPTFLTFTLSSWPLRFSLKNFAEIPVWNYCYPLIKFTCPSEFH